MSEFAFYAVLAALIVPCGSIVIVFAIAMLVSLIGGDSYGK